MPKSKHSAAKGKRTVNKTWTRLRVAGVIMLAATSMSACSSADTPNESTTVSATETGINNTPQLTDSKVVTEDLKQETCENTPGKAAATGEVTNSADTARDIVVLITWTNIDDAQTLATSVVTLRDVPADATWGYRAENVIDTEPDTETMCTVVAYAGTLP